MKNTLAATLVAASALIVTAVQAATPEVEALLQAAQKEGAVYSVGMPNTWANWVKTWSDLQTKYKIKTQDTDMASAEQISKFMAEGENATSDIGDVGFEFGEIAKKRGITMPYKPSTWDQIPGWAKDPDGHWCLAYTGTVAFIINKELVKEDGTMPAVGDTLPFKVVELRRSTKKIVVSHVKTYAADEPKAGKPVSEADSTKKAVKKINSNIEKTTLGDIDALAALKDKLEKGE